MALLQVNKAIEAEAAQVLYGKNVWGVTVRASDLQDYVSSNALLQKKTLWSQRGKFFRHIEICFNQGDMDAQWFSSSTSAIHAKRPACTPNQLVKKTHDLARILMEVAWLGKFAHVKDMEFLRTVSFDFDFLYCHAGCCRAGMVYLALGHLERLLLRPMMALTISRPWSGAGMKIAVKGLKTDEEREEVRGLGMTLVEEQESL